ncbi:hypothetical protein QWT69_05265 [Sporosarcina oncorhynchi]|uniref:Tissue inhibitor of metalloproteinase n=1 Tax=Sporosarcina oncorhynchi TaxID=3056444 RepID=A0ABZ0L7I4_9BACL|nr:hypothetical protein [Sporosarcina sp. T2O-4]WOV88525.1 hypothetical protein QWT69_05265 [Sporosarcina sp. T2O-4]
MYKRFLMPFLIIVVTVFLWRPIDAAACSCVMPPPPEQALNDATAVFSGEVIDISDNVKVINGYGKTIRFKVDESWKGIDNGEVAINTGHGGGDCGFQFEVGQSYLVYAVKSDMYAPNTLSTTICNRTVQLANANDDLTALGEGEKIFSEHEDVVEKSNWFYWSAGLSSIILLGAAFVYGRKMKNARR